MKSYRKVQKEVEELHVHTCDLCGKDLKKRKPFDGGYADVSGGVGTSFPEGNNITHYDLDVCAECFVDKLVPLIEDHFDVRFQEEQD